MARGPRKLRVAFDGVGLTQFGGVALIEQFVQRIESEWKDTCLDDKNLHFGDFINLRTPVRYRPKGELMPSPESSRLNLANANARRPPGTPRPWRSERESRVIRRRAWNWFTNDRGATCSARKLARLLGVSHTWIQKLVSEFQSDPSKILHEVRIYGSASWDDLRRAQQETVRDRERGWLRSSAQKPSDLAPKPRYQYEEKSEWELEAARQSRFVEYLRSRPRSRAGCGVPECRGFPAVPKPAVSTLQCASPLEG